MKPRLGLLTWVLDAPMALGLPWVRAGVCVCSQAGVPAPCISLSLTGGGLGFCQVLKVVGVPRSVSWHPCAERKLRLGFGRSWKAGLSILLLSGGPAYAVSAA